MFFLYTKEQSSENDPIFRAMIPIIVKFQKRKNTHYMDTFLNRKNPNAPSPAKRTPPISKM